MEKAEFRFFKKRGPGTPIYLKDGKKISFNNIIGEFGYTRTNDPRLFKIFDNCISNRSGGISEITQTQYEQEFLSKKHLSSSTPVQRQREQLQSDGKDGLLNRAVRESDLKPEPKKAPVEPANKMAGQNETLPEDLMPKASKITPAKKD